TFRTELTKLRAKEQSDLHHADPRTALRDSELAAAAALVTALTQALAPLEDLPPGEHGFADLAARHREVIAALSFDPGAAAAAFAGHDGTALAGAFDAVAETESAATFRVRLSDYAELFEAAIGDRVVRRPGLPGVQVRILGPLEARLTSADRVVLGGL